MAEAPEIFHVDESGRLTLLSETPDSLLAEKALAAEKFCPARAIKILPQDA
jgi:sterol 14-demethylase